MLCNWFTIISFKTTIKKVAGIKLQARFGSGDVEHAAARWIINVSGWNEAFTRAIQNEVVIVTPGGCEIFPIALPSVKSHGEFATARISPVGMRSSDTGVKASALSVNS